MNDILKRARAIFSKEVIAGVICVSALLVAYYFILAKPFFTRQYFFAGDTQYHWSLNYFTLYALKYFNSLPWWDPTVYNGYPLYFHIISGWSNYLGPFYLPSLAIFKVLSSFFAIPITSYIIFHRTIYIVGLNIIGVYLVTRQLVRTRIAAALAALVFTFSYFQILNFHDFYALEAMIAPLFFLFGLFHYNNRRDIKSLAVCAGCAAALLASIDNGMTMSAMYWLFCAAGFTLLFFRDLLSGTVRLIKNMWAIGIKGRVYIGIMLAALVSSGSAAFLPVILNWGEVLKYRGGVVSYFSSGGITNHPIPITSAEVWTLVSTWLPFADIQKLFFNYAWHGHEYHYIGMVTLPLVLIAAILGFRNRYVWVSLLTFFICNGFVIYGEQTLAYKALTDHSQILKNIANINTIFPRGGPLLFLIFIAAIGFDIILAGKSCEGSSPDARPRRPVNWLMLSCAVFTGICALLIGIMYFYSLQYVSLFVLPIEKIWHTVFHVMIYFGIFVFLFSALFRSRDENVRRPIIVAVFIFSFVDLIVSLSYTIDARDLSLGNGAPSYYGRVPYTPLWEVPDNTSFGPINNVGENMFPQTYRGVYHNSWTIQWGLKSWLTLASTPYGLRFLENWDPNAIRMRKYPDFKFFTNGYYIPFKNIDEVRSRPAITACEPLFYLHDKKLTESINAVPAVMQGTYNIVTYSPNTVIIRTNTASDGVLLFLDNYERFWNAYIDGKRTPVYRANFTFKAVRIAKGEHVVAWVYDPLPVKGAYLVFYLALTALLAYGIVFRRELFCEK